MSKTIPVYEMTDFAQVFGFHLYFQFYTYYYCLDMLQEMRPVSISIRDINSINLVEFHIHDLLRPLWSLTMQTQKVFRFHPHFQSLYETTKT